MPEVIEDQVERRLAFEDAHPEWFIRFDGDAFVWRAIEEGVEGPAHVVIAPELKELLDKLEARYRELAK